MKKPLNIKKLVLLNLPYILMGLFSTNFGEAWRMAQGADPRGNLTRIDNALSQMPQRLESVKVQLDNLYQQQAAAKEEVGKAFPYEEELRVKNARLVELDMELNMDSKGQSRPEAAIAKRERPSVLEGLKRPIPPRSMEKKPRQQEQEAR